MPLEAAYLTVHLTLGNAIVGTKAPVQYTRVADTGYPPGITRYEHQSVDGQIGLLQGISTPDLRDTEIYVSVWRRGS